MKNILSITHFRKNIFSELLETKVCLKSKLYVVLKGLGHLTINGKKIEITDRQVVIVLKKQKVESTVINGEGLSISLDDDLNNSWHDYHNVLHYLSLFEISTDKHLLSSKMYYKEIESLIIFLLGMEEKELINKIKPFIFSAILNLFQFSLSKNSMIIDKTVMKFLSSIEENVHENLEVKDYASLLSVSEDQLRRVCKRFLNKSPLVTINDMRLYSIKREMAQRELTISEIAIKYNFFDSSHLYKFFKQRTDLSPKDFLKSIW